ncbi:carbohydrate ABC transporter ATP-binding protein, CUT1 family [Faunimonas pinastri]|uniref:Carbohydrate ABC transporter ATP-binding protein, CUT1 family n=1 Tax=Faunimonas pinastri TaxID=1855383 RepID=A0A1H9ANZ1_9HYPH|nr:sn-glycerol-3-phosphate ABC transporter ATP-binding protein UgpC [Faunimonas pinastri]SEP78420.1 carbohydrate ABC transporter ATP-binding protein, CUT1 family [Faunimonas pinastri]
MAEVVLRSVDKTFGSVRVIKSVDLHIADGEFCVFVGPSGCGKSTLLRLIAGLEEVTSGAVEIGGEDVTRLPPASRGIAMVFQSYALYPHMTVADNITFGLRTAGAEKADTARRLEHASKMLELDTLLDRKPAQLSGGQRQRVAIGRAIVRDPQVFLFDEPLSNLDAALRTQMRIEIGGLHKDLNTTMIYVTHDQVEAMTMADKIVVLRAGQVEQVGAPLDLYSRPANLFVAGFIGSPKMNFLEARAEAAGDVATIRLPGGGELRMPLQGQALSSGQSVILGVRPEHLSLQHGGTGGMAEISGTVRLAEHLGAETVLYIDVADGAQLIVRANGIMRERTGDAVRVVVDPAACHLFAPEGPALVNATLS